MQSDSNEDSDLWMDLDQVFLNSNPAVPERKSSFEAVKTESSPATDFFTHEDADFSANDHNLIALGSHLRPSGNDDKDAATGFAQEAFSSTSIEEIHLALPTREAALSLEDKFSFGEAGVNFPDQDGFLGVLETDAGFHFPEQEVSLSFSTDEESSIFSNKRNSTDLETLVPNMDDSPMRNPPVEKEKKVCLTMEALNYNGEYIPTDSVPRTLEVEVFLAEPVLSLGNISGQHGQVPTSVVPRDFFSSAYEYVPTELDFSQPLSFLDLNFSWAMPAENKSDSLNYTYNASEQSSQIPKKRQCPTPPQETAKAKASGTKKPRKNTVPKRIFDYSQVKIFSHMERAPQLQNNARLPDPGTTNHQMQLVILQNQSGCVINRTRYVRSNLDPLRYLHPNVIYEKNELFEANNPYQQEFTRVEIDPESGLPINETRSGLCPYCEDLSFYELKNSSYAQHLSHSHGVFTDNFLTPNPLHIGHYAVAKSTNSPRKTTARVRSHEGVVCPACYKVVEIRCWSSTLVKKPLSNYLRHFKEEHRVGKNRSTYFRAHV